MISYVLTAYENGKTVGGFNLNENQINLMALALCDYQDCIYDEDSPYYDEQDASDFSQLQGNLNCI